MAVFVGLSLGLTWPVYRATPEVDSMKSALDTISSLAGDPSWVSHASGIVGLWAALWWCYFLVGWGLAGCTPGKWLLGLRVADYEGRCPIGGARASLRLVAYMASSVTLVLGHLMIVFRKDRRALHDLLAGTRVVRWRGFRRRGPEPEPRTESDEAESETEPESETKPESETESESESESEAETK